MKSFFELDIRTGRLTTFQGDFPEIESELRNKEIKRVSRIVPKNLLLRGVFYVLRSIPSDPLAEYTRRWKCLWYLEFNGLRFYSRKRSCLVEIERSLYISRG